MELGSFHREIAFVYVVIATLNDAAEINKRTEITKKWNRDLRREVARRAE